MLFVCLFLIVLLVEKYRVHPLKTANKTLTSEFLFSMHFPEKKYSLFSFLFWTFVKFTIALFFYYCGCKDNLNSMYKLYRERKISSNNLKRNKNNLRDSL